MLPKQHRLPLRKELFRVQKEGKIIQGKLFSLLTAKRLQSGPSRFGFIISSKIHKKAVKRNRARRLLIEAVHSFLGQVKPGFDSVFLVKKAILDKEKKEVEEEVEKIFQQSTLLS